MAKRPKPPDDSEPEQPVRRGPLDRDWLGFDHIIASVHDTLPAVHLAIIAAIERKRVMALRFRGTETAITAEPHLYGRSKGADVVVLYVLAGEVADEWKAANASEIASAELLSKKFRKRLIPDRFLGTSVH